MKMSEMDKYFESKGFAVEREYHQSPSLKSGGFYTFDISKNGITMHRVYKWPEDQKKFMDKLISDFEDAMGHTRRDDSLLPKAIAATFRWSPTEHGLAYMPDIEHDIKITKEMWSKMNPYIPQRYGIKNVIFNDPATIVLWADGTKTVVKADGEKFDPEKGLAMAISKKALGNEGNYYNTFKKWLPKNSMEDLFEKLEAFKAAVEQLRTRWGSKGE